ncbi:methyltransferase domain-containing protein [Yinghuangia sp. ASG 101]|uniref:methyltransferase domain-containing protein n=1 Tax=Yinghuangia sp. ASG 101 TaxID=2896848 RepID=UPI001E34E5FA|nr:methyltransferase domain-containing protein [Yinghuangia sp. ASG 101]UGQ09418.1 methyltransferase domain-containing protein [Yinghuangia sp. ASG 101]
MSDAPDNASVRLLGRDRTPFLPDRLWLDGAWVSRADRPARWEEAARADVAVTTQTRGVVPSSSASMPSVVADILDACAVRPGHRVLEIGAGTGYTAALLKDRVGPHGSVASIEVDPEVAARARRNLDAAGVDVEVVCGDGFAGLKRGGPYDRVHVTCAMRHVPTAWLEQCAGGRIAMPWGPAFSTDRVVALDVADGQGVGRFGAVASFMVMRAQRSRAWDAWPEGGETRPVDLGLDWRRLDGPLGGFGEFVVGLLLPGVTHRTSGGDPEDGERVVWLERDGVYASVGFGAGVPTTATGDERLIRDYADAVAWWYDHGRPESAGFGLTVTADGERAHQRVWFGSPHGPAWEH